MDNSHDVRARPNRAFAACRKWMCARRLCRRVHAEGESRAGTSSAELRAHATEAEADLLHSVPAVALHGRNFLGGGIGVLGDRHAVVAEGLGKLFARGVRF